MRKAGIYPQYMAILEGLSSQWALAIVLTCSPDTGGIMDAVERSISKFERFKIQCPKSKQVDSVAENRTLVGRFNVFIELRQIVCRTEYSSQEIDFLSLPSNWVPYNWFLHQWRSTKSGIIGMVSINYYICFTLLLRLPVETTDAGVVCCNCSHATTPWPCNATLTLTESSGSK